MSKLDVFKIAEVELVYRRPDDLYDRPVISKSEEAYALFKQNWNDCTITLQEEFKILLLDRAGHCLGLATIAKGGIANVLVDPKIIFSIALKARATGIILAHNHPGYSGDVDPCTGDTDPSSLAFWYQ